VDHRSMTRAEGDGPRHDGAACVTLRVYFVMGNSRCASAPEGETSR
jgi:hypothetical protein